MLLRNKHASKLLLHPNKKINTTKNNIAPQVLLLLNHQFGPTTSTTINTNTTTIRKYHSNFITTSVGVTIDEPTKVDHSSTISKVNYFPIGETNFESIIRNSQFYIDKTHCIPAIEKQLSIDTIVEERCGIKFKHPKEITLTRPNGWGKSTFLSMLHCYYDVKKKNDFNTIFGNLHIGNNYTINRNSYYVMKFDFSNAKSNFTTIEEFNHEINSIIKNSLLQCIDYYQLQSKLDLLDTKSSNYRKFRPFESMKNKETIANIELLYHVCNYLKLNNSNKLLILVDEFDKQVNELILENQQLFHSFKKSCYTEKGEKNQIYDPLEDFLQHFYQFNNNGFVIHRVYVNTTPITFTHNEVHVLTISKPNWDDEFQDCMGFTVKELKQFTFNNYKLNDEIIEKLIANYGNYHFRGCKSLLNPSLVLREFNGGGGEDLIQPQLPINSKKYEKLLDHIENLDPTNEQYYSGFYFQPYINFNRFVEHHYCWTPENFVSYLLYQGLLSVKGKRYRDETFSIPNLFAKQSLSERHYQKLQLIIEKLNKSRNRMIATTTTCCQ